MADRTPERLRREQARPASWVVIDFSRAACESRQAWWLNGAPGHWPGCPCGVHRSLDADGVDVVKPKGEYL